METVFIYEENDPRDLRTRYIGKTKHPKQRHQAHITLAKQGEKSHKANWIRSLLAAGDLPVMKIIDEVPAAEWGFWEREYIRLYRALGFQLTNTTEGGEGVPDQSGDKHPNFGKSLPEKTRERIRKAHTGMRASPEARENMRVGQLLGNNSVRGKFGAQHHNFGKHWDRDPESFLRGEEHPNFGKAMPEEQKQQIRAAKIGKPLSAEHCSKLSIAQQAWRAKERSLIPRLEDLSSLGKRIFLGLAATAIKNKRLHNRDKQRRLRATHG